MHESIDFTGQVAVVAGGASGIGRACGIELAKEGADVVVADIDEDRGSEVADEIEDDHGQRAVFEHTDVSDHDSCAETMARADEELGGVDVLINSAAGGLGGSLADLTKKFVDETPEDWEPQFEVTFRGALNTAHTALPYMIEGGGGSIVIFSSDSYQGHDDDVAVYSAAKAALVTFAKSLSREVGEHDVRVNAVSPSTTRTPANEGWVEKYGDKIVENYPLGRLGKPVDQANAAVFLASDAADWITGQTLSVNGGFL